MLDITTDDQITLLTLNRPERHNAFGPELIQAITKTLRRLADDPGTRVVIITGAGRSFSAGADLNYMKSMVDFSHEDNVSDAGHLADMLDTLHRFPKPLIAAVNGNAMAGATGMVAASDIVIAASDARFAITEVRLGIAPAVISPWLIARIGVHNARRFFLTAEPFNADQAKAMDLVHEIVPPDALLTRARDIAAQLLHNGPEALQATKELIRVVAPPVSSDETRRYTCELIARLRTSEEGQQGLTAFFSKEVPPWVPTSRGEGS